MLSVPIPDTCLALAKVKNWFIAVFWIFSRGVEVWSAPGGTAPGSCGRRWWQWAQAPQPVALRCGKNPQASSSSARKSDDPSPASTHTRSSNQTRQAVRVQRHRGMNLCTGDSAGSHAGRVCAFVYTMQQRVEHSWSRLHGDVSSRTLYCSVHGSLSRTIFSTFQSVSCNGETNKGSVSSYVFLNFTLTWPPERYWPYKYICMYFTEPLSSSHKKLLKCTCCEPRLAVRCFSTTCGSHSFQFDSSRPNVHNCIIYNKLLSCKSLSSIRPIGLKAQQLKTRL